MKQFVRFAIPSLLLLAALLVNHRRQQDPVYVLSRYPKTPLFTKAVDAYLKPSEYHTTLVLAETSFDKTFASDLECGIAQDGARTCWSGSLLWGSFGGSGDISPAQLDAIKTILRDMPPTLNQPAPENLLLVGFWQNEKWTVQLHDQSRLPWQIKRIHQIIKAE